MDALTWLGPSATVPAPSSAAFSAAATAVPYASFPRDTPHGSSTMKSARGGVVQPDPAHVSDSPRGEATPTQPERSVEGVERSQWQPQLIQRLVPSKAAAAQRGEGGVDLLDLRVSAE